MQCSGCGSLTLITNLAFYKLGCNHVYCQKCLGQLQIGYQVRCFICNSQQYSQQVQLVSQGAQQSAQQQNNKLMFQYQTTNPSQSQIQSQQNQICLHHYNLCLFICTVCNTHICNECKSQQHQGHNFASILEVQSQQGQIVQISQSVNLSQLSEQVNRQIQKINQEIQSLSILKQEALQVQQLYQSRINQPIQYLIQQQQRIKQQTYLHLQVMKDEYNQLSNYEQTLDFLKIKRAERPSIFQLLKMVNIALQLTSKNTRMENAYRFSIQLSCNQQAIWSIQQLYNGMIKLRVVQKQQNLDVGRQSINQQQIPQILHNFQNLNIQAAQEQNIQNAQVMYNDQKDQGNQNALSLPNLQINQGLQNQQQIQNPQEMRIPQNILSTQKPQVAQDQQINFQQIQNPDYYQQNNYAQQYQGLQNLQGRESYRQQQQIQPFEVINNNQPIQNIRSQNQQNIPQQNVQSNAPIIKNDKDQITLEQLQKYKLEEKDLMPLQEVISYIRQMDQESQIKLDFLVVKYNLYKPNLQNVAFEYIAGQQS